MPRGAPRTIFSSASVKSASWTFSWPRRAASSAASLARLARSAPTMPGVVAASRSRSTSSSSGSERVWTSRICRGRPCRAAAPRRGGRSGRGAAAPGRGSRAGWSRRARSPATLDSKPSISVRIWLSVCSRSSLPPPNGATPAVRERPIASSSSMKMIAGEASLACLKRSRTREAPMPTIASTNSDAEIGEERHVRLARDGAREQRLAGARAAGEQHAARDPAAEPLVAVGVLEVVDDLGQLGLRLVDAGHVGERDVGGAALHAAGARAAELAERAHLPAAARRASQTNSATSRITGPKPRSRFISDAAAWLIGSAEISTSFSCSSRVELVRVGERRDLGVEVLGRLGVLVVRRVGDLLLELARDRLARSRRSSRRCPSSTCERNVGAVRGSGPSGSLPGANSATLR